MRPLFSHATCQLPMGHIYDKSAGCRSGANSASPEVNLALGTNSASPKPGIGYLLPTNLAGGHSFNCGVHVYESWSELNHDLRRTSVLPEPSFSLDTSNGKALNIIVYCRVDVLIRGFSPYSVLCQPLQYEEPPCQGARVRVRALGSQHKLGGDK
jgi:hypothetical protein